MEVVGVLEEVRGEEGMVVVVVENREGWRARWLVRLRRGRVRLVILVSWSPFLFFAPFLGSDGEMGGGGGRGDCVGFFWSCDEFGLL